jgi:hypothetical protein
MTFKSGAKSIEHIDQMSALTGAPGLSSDVRRGRYWMCLTAGMHARIGVRKALRRAEQTNL